MSPSLPQTLTFDRDGFALVPHGLLATIETSLERSMPPQPDLFPLLAGHALVQPDPVDLSAFKALFRAIGDPWLWHARLTLPDADILAILRSPDTTLRYLVGPGGTTLGLFEARRQTSETLEISYLGLVPASSGRGLGPPLLEHGLAAAWRPGLARAWLHTCTFDHPAAVPFYRRMGFRPFRHRVDLMPDPRLTGVLPRHVAPHIPLADLSDP